MAAAAGVHAADQHPEPLMSPNTLNEMQLASDLLKQLSGGSQGIAAGGTGKRSGAKAHLHPAQDSGAAAAAAAEAEAEAEGGQEAAAEDAAALVAAAALAAEDGQPGEATQARAFRGVKAARGTKNLLKGSLRSGWQPNFSVRVDAKGAPDSQHTAKQVSLAACSSAAEAAVARDVGVLWRELHAGGAGHAAGQQYNFDYSRYAAEEGLLAGLRELATLKAVQGYAISLRDSGWLRRFAAGEAGEQQQEALPAPAAPGEGDAGAAAAAAAQAEAGAEDGSISGSQLAQQAKPSTSKRAAAPAPPSRQASGGKRARAEAAPALALPAAAAPMPAAPAAAVVPAEEEPMSVVQLHQQLEAISQSEEGQAASITAVLVLDYCAAYSTRLAPAQQRDQLLMLEHLFEAGHYEQAQQYLAAVAKCCGL